MYVKTSKALLPFTLLLSLLSLLSFWPSPPRLLSFRYASTVDAMPRSSSITTTTTTTIYVFLLRVSISILDTHVTRTCFPCEYPALYFSALSSSSSLSLFSAIRASSYSPRGNQFPFATQPTSSPTDHRPITTYLHADISSYSTRIGFERKQRRLARSIPLDRAVLPFRVHHFSPAMGRIGG